MPSNVGVIDHINHEKSIIHVIVARGVDGTCSGSLFDGQASIGDAVAVRLAQHHSKQGVRTRIVEIEHTDQALSSDICRQFRDTANVTPSGLGFTLGDIFIPPNVIAAEGIQDGDLVEGIAIASFDKKRGNWGMKAVRAKSVTRNSIEFGNEVGSNYENEQSLLCQCQKMTYDCTPRM